MERRLAAILVADMVGYSRFMAADERGTIERQKAHRSAVIDPKIAQYGGRIVKTTGDGLLVEFPSVFDSVQCAIEIQRAMVEREADIDDAERIRYRIGINLGDIVIDGADILGDGVNVAARLEGLAEPGGLCISDVVYQNILGKLDQSFEDLGCPDLKNIQRKVRVWRSVDLSDAASRDAPPARAIPSLPEKPTIAVMPFENLSDEQEQAIFADGISEDITTNLSKIMGLLVIARNSTRTYRGHAQDVRQIAVDLGVRNVLQGSVRKARDRLRVTAQLIDAQTGGHLWAERYDRQIGDLFDLQDEITERIVTALQVQLTEGEQAAIRRRQTEDLAAWHRMVRGQDLLRRFTREDNRAARELFEQAVDVDPEFASAWSMLAWTHLVDARLGYTESSTESLEQGAALARRGLEIHPDDPDGLAIMGAIRLFQRRFEEAEDATRRAVESGPNLADGLVWRAIVLNYTGRPAEALGRIAKAMRLSPYFPDWYLGIQAVSYRALGQLEQAIAADKARLERNPENQMSNSRLAAIYAERGDLGEARAQIVELLSKNPKASISQVRVSEPFQDEIEMERYLDLLRQAGLPE